MTKRLSLLLAFGLSSTLALPACRKSEPVAQPAAQPAAPPAAGKDPVARLLAHTDSMIEILKRNEADPPKAIQELTAYREKNQAEIEQEKHAMSELMQKDPMRIAAASSLYGMKSAELEARAAELTAKVKAQ